MPKNHINVVIGYDKQKSSYIQFLQGYLLKLYQPSYRILSMYLTFVSQNVSSSRYVSNYGLLFKIPVTHHGFSSITTPHFSTYTNAATAVPILHLFSLPPTEAVASTLTLLCVLLFFF